MSRTPIKQPDFLPMTRSEMDRLGWKELDILLVTGDAYVDHPSFGAPLLGRWLVSRGYRTGLVAQPRWNLEAGDPGEVAAMGRPRLFAGVTAGSLDSMLAHYTAFRKKRSDDAYTPGGQAGSRPNRAAIAYANLVRRAFPGIPVALGGIEASLRRVSHYDFWSQSLRRSILFDAKATVVLYGMAEHSILALAEALDRLSGEGGDLADALARIPGAVHARKAGDLPEGLSPQAVLELPSHEAMLADPGLLLKASLLSERHVHQNRQVAVQVSGDRMAVLTPPGQGLDGAALDALYALPFSKEPHPSYRQPIPAADMIRGSLNIHRGCAGGCSFCTLALHQGRAIRSRSRASVLAEAVRLVDVQGFTGSISDVGGPSANMWGARCTGDMEACLRASCLTPKICRHFKADQGGFVDLLAEIARLPGVRHVRVASGWRMDLGLADKEALARMIRDFTGGQAKVAPEHTDARVLRLMRKPPFAVFEEFVALFQRESGRAGKEQYVVPYLMSAFPGCTVESMRQMAAWFAGRGWKPNQIQCFIPLPGTAAAAMFFAGTDLEGNPLPVATSDAERLCQHAVLGAEPKRPHARKDSPERKPAGRPAGVRGRGKDATARPAAGRPRKRQ
ncbi:Radical SAM domain protein [Solidesulfovibrio carbinoliphilus subsp. oakridgensis]|uniref:Radical SAM domain protein n=1 Tax=Solidesulfovibrio carbinoliphilus subsp. oakridgensis TaxID=694327 RepID=G7Q4U9_9BACT|nr:YgiQ family radical SAM protein [Solidesulfovibrio carbinoliphilus]EHJ47559.1 Radical SAM domain protein [Solidesulfovibrio carbinoliphilus subsp. oakridgensis]